MKFRFPKLEPPPWISAEDWTNWKWQFRSSLTTQQDFERYFELSSEERKGFLGADRLFRVRTTPYYASLADPNSARDPIRKILMPHASELELGAQQMLDPLGERRHNPAPRIIHRYPDRLLLLVTDTCSVYCRYCTRKHFTAHDQALVKKDEYQVALDYIRSSPGVREVILSGGDPLTLADGPLERVLSDLRQIEHVEIIRIGSRIPVVCPMRVTEDLARLLRKYAPIYLMAHFNHPRELTEQSVEALTTLVDHGVPVMNQMVLLNGVNNHPAVVQALSRRLLYLRVKPYYMFQCDPSEGTDHLRTSVQNSLDIQRELWGRLSGLAMPSLSLDIPDGGGKVGLVPDFQIDQGPGRRSYRGWDGVEAEYVDPAAETLLEPSDVGEYLDEWNELKSQRYGRL